MIDIIDNRLKLEGYCFLKVNPEEAGVYYRFVEGTAQVVIGFYGHEKFQISHTQMELLLKNLRELFWHPQGRLEKASGGTAIHDVQVLALFVTDYPERYKELCTGEYPVWLYDTGKDQLLIYENQPGDFHGLRAIMEAVAVEGEKRHFDSESIREYQGVAGKVDWSRIPVVSAALAVVNVIVFLILTVQGDTENPVFMLEHGAIYPELVLQGGEWYRLFTCMFLHFGVEHLMNNMVILIVAGMQLEHALGKIRYLLLYLISGVGSSLLSLTVMTKTGDLAVAAGASGAVFGIIGALLWVAVRNRGKFENLTTRGLIIMIALCLYYGFTSTGVDNWGHIGGLLTGFVLCILLYRKKIREKG